VQVVEAEVVKSVEVTRNLALAACVMPSAKDFKAKLLTVDESTPLFECTYLSSESCDGHILQSKSGEARCWRDKSLLHRILYQPRIF
jgi:hypothetical protein